MRGKGFELNSYDPCVANKIIGGKKMTVFWNVDNIKVPHVEPKEFTNLMKCIGRIYGELMITRGNIREYLGMRLYLQTPGELRVTMVDHLKGVLEYLP